MGHQWYGNWGYELGRGSFGLTTAAYEEALRTLSTEHLSHLFSNTLPPNRELQNTIASYQFLSDNSFITVGDLFSAVSNGHEIKSLVQKQVPVEPKGSSSY